MDNSGVSTITLNIKCGASPTSQIQIDPAKLISDLREVVTEKYSSSLALTVIIHKGRILKEDAQSITAAGIVDRDTVLVWIKSAQSSPKVQPSPNASRPVTSETVGNTPFDMGRIGGMQGLQNLGMGSPNLAEIQQRMSREIMSNPESFKNLMESPMVRSMLNNPESLQSILQANPQFREILDANPELAHALNNPEIIRESMEYANNPNMLLEMMRNHDRSISNIENLPGGMNALQRMYTDVEEPMRQAVAEMSSRGNEAAPPPADIPGRSINEPLPNLWSTGGSQPRPRVAPQGPPQTSSAQPAQAPAGLESYVNQAMANPEFMSNMLQSPYMSSMLDSLSTNPEMMRMMVETMPAVANNPQLRDQMISNMPTMLQQMRNQNTQQLMANPRAMAAMLKIQQGMQELHAEAPGFLESLTAQSGTMAQTPSTTTTQQPPSAAPNYYSVMSNMLQQQNMAAQLPPRERYASQLRQLSTMGFTNDTLNIEVLDRVGGDLNRAIDILLGNN